MMTNRSKLFLLMVLFVVLCLACRCIGGELDGETAMSAIQSMALEASSFVEDNDFQNPQIKNDDEKLANDVCSNEPVVPMKRIDICSEFECERRETEIVYKLTDGNRLLRCENVPPPHRTETQPHCKVKGCHPHQDIIHVAPTDHRVIPN